MNIFITGIAGFIGSNIARRMAKRGCYVTGIDNLSTGKISNLEGSNNVFFYEADINTQEGLLAIKRRLSQFKFDVFIHLAANASIVKSNENPLIDVNTNFISTINILDIVKKYGVKHFIFASSMVTYGDMQAPFSVEETPCIPKSTYGISKYAAERYTEEFCLENNINYSIFRMFNVYGPYQDLFNPYQGVAAIFIGKMLKDEKIMIYGDGSKTRDFVYVNDVVDFYESAIEEPFNTIVNLGSGKETKIIDLAKKIVDLYSYKPDYSCIIYKEERKREQQNSYADMSRFKDYKFTSLDDGLKLTIDWAKEKYAKN